MNIKNKKLRKRGLPITLTSLALLLGTGVLINSPFDSVQANDINVLSNPEVTSDKVISTNTTNWKYLDDNSDPAGSGTLNSWTLSTFNDSAWKSAVGKFGAKKGQLTSFDGFTPTVLLNQYYEGSKDTPTFFFRTKFNVTNLEDITSISGKFYHDDAVAIYLNGHLISSVDMPTDPQTNNLYYAGVSAGAPKEGNINLDAERVKEYLVTGENVVAVELHNDRESSSDIYFDFSELSINKNEVVQVEQKSVLLIIGSDETSRNLTWYANDSSAGTVQFAKKTAMVNGTFPSDYASATATSSASNDAGYYSNQATLSGLEANCEYVYRVVNNETTSEIYSFKTGNFDGSFIFALAGDPQIGAGSQTSDTEGWGATLETIVSQLNPDFLVSAGDQVNTASNESQYAGYTNSILSSLASATTIGNHDSSSVAYQQHFNLANESSEYGITNAGSDYYFVYNNTLFMDINSNNLSSAEHKAFMEAAIAANPDVKWKTVIFHHSVYSTASHVSDTDIINRRNELPQIFDELDIDVVLMGHDHVYTRTYMMNGVTPDTSNGIESSVVDPTGILYLTANSASGSKYYDIKAPNAEYSAVMDQSKRRTITKVSVSDTAYTLTTYFADDMTLLDTFTINKSVDVDKTQLQELIKKADALKDSDYTSDSWKIMSAKLTAAKEVSDNQDATAEDVEIAYNDLNRAIQALVKITNTSTSTTTTGNQDKVSTGDTTNVAALGLLMLSAGGMIILNRKKLLKK